MKAKSIIFNLAVLVALVLIGVWTVPAQAAGSWTVNAALADNSNCISPTFQCQTIQAAINAASEGDTINVAAGTYTEQVVITKGLTIVGDELNPDNVVIDGQNSTSLTLDGQVRIYNPTGPVVFKGFKIVNGATSSGTYFAILTKGAQSRTIQNSKIIGHGNSVGLGEDYGLWAYTGTGELVISNNYFKNMYHAILLERQSGATTVENNTFDALFTGTYTDGYKYGGRAIEAITYGSMNVTSLQEIKGNKFVNFASTGVQFSGGFSGQTPGKFTNVVIEDNNFDFATTDITNLNGAVYLKNVSTPSNNDPAGGVSANIRNNVVHVPSGNGIIVTGLNGTITINNNSIAGNLFYGLKADGSLGSTIDASSNYWGSTDLATVAGNISGTVDFTPLLDSGTDTNDPAPGFQPSLSSLTVHTLGSQTSSTGRIQESINLVSGSTVNVAAGTYTEQVTITKSLELIGAGEGSTTILAPTARAGSVTHNGTTHDYLLAAYATNGTIDVRVEGFTLDVNGQNKTTGTARLDGVFFRDVKDASGTLAGLFASTIHNFAATPAYESWGLAVYGDSLLTLNDNDISDYTRDGILVIGGNVTVSNNTVTGSATPLNGINIQDVTTGAVTSNTITGHTRSDPWAAGGIVAWTSSGLTISGNHVNGNFYGINLEDGSNNNFILNNELTDNIKRGITLSDADNNAVSGNTIIGPVGGTDDVAIGLSNGSTGNMIGGSTQVDGNTITMATSGYWASPPLLYAIWVDNTVGAGSNTIQYNTITGGKRGIQIDGGNIGTTTIANNTISNTPTGPEYPIFGIGINGGTVNITSNTLTNTVRPIESWGAINLEITGNTIDGSTYDGINLGSFSGTATVIGNNIHGTQGNGILARELADNANIDGNEIYNVTGYAAIVIETGSTGAKINNNYLHENNGGVAANAQTAEFNNNIILNSGFGILLNAPDTTFELHQNSIVGNPLNLNLGNANVEMNWWGDSSGPSGVGSGIGSPIYLYNSNTVDFDPWLCDGTDTENSTPGFQPNLDISCAGPVTSNVVANLNLVPVGALITLTANVDDTSRGGSDILSAEYSLDGGGTWAGMQAQDGAFDAVGEDVTATITAPSAPGVYDLCVRGTDVGGAIGESSCILLVVYDPAAGFVTGAGWINSPEGAYIAYPDLSGKATFGFVAKYKKGATVPDGNTQFQFKAGDLDFKSTSYEWLVVAGARAQFKGTGAINGAGEYGFMLTAIDGQISGGGGVDRFRIKIWEKSTDKIIYDNMLDAADDATQLTELGGGSIVIHK
ncbi:MAG: hypothetical protein A2X25_11335 [Chloroflexi bacterium GWB2_49_20]|nr:MAG: hypothetical protein A2X25_11335 [Chloroflexi bacterium GWB2_49_20]OGN78859.1 MAG: hypothetical protein A2X26_00015 [Chloroflexi bacterium GWC2_49_37]OGN86381.1 MAG: hypothetical protein A2X27_05760 [Chloroflexi bacterium GWD2_49_16]HBG74617.1 hypothetical protein [Anaerolineae bacterium]